MRLSPEYHDVVQGVRIMARSVRQIDLLPRSNFLAARSLSSCSLLSSNGLPEQSHSLHKPNFFPDLVGLLLTDSSPFEQAMKPPMIVSILVALFVVSITERRYSGLIDNRSFKLSERNPYVCSRLFSESSASKSSSMSTSMIVVMTEN